MVGDVAEIESDSVGNLVAHREGDGPLLALFAHLDVIGAAVAHVGDDALVAVHQLGSWRANVAYGQRVEIRAQGGVVPGVIARKVKDNEKVEVSSTSTSRRRTRTKPARWSPRATRWSSMQCR